MNIKGAIANGHRCKAKHGAQAPAWLNDAGATPTAKPAVIGSNVFMVPLQWHNCVRGHSYGHAIAIVATRVHAHSQGP